MDKSFKIRAMRPDDGQSLSELYLASPDTGQIQIGPRYHVDAHTAFTATRPDAAGVVVEAPNLAGLAGAGFIHFGHCAFAGDLRKYAALSGVVVHPDYRRLRIASRIVKWRIDYANKRIGAEGIILATIQKGNEGSFSVAKEWSRQFVGNTKAGVTRVRSEPPESVNGITVRKATSNELAVVADGLNNFYRAYNFYTPHEAESLSNWIARSPFDTPINHYYVAVDAAGTILAGAAVTEEYRMVEMHVHHIPIAMQWLNKVVKLVPPDGILKQLAVNKIWLAPGKMKAAQFLWETLRWEWRKKANSLTVFFDPRSPVTDVFKLPVWLPKGQFVLAVRGPVPIDEETFLYPL